MNLISALKVLKFLKKKIIKINQNLPFTLEISVWTVRKNGTRILRWEPSSSHKGLWEQQPWEMCQGKLPWQKPRNKWIRVGWARGKVGGVVGSCGPAEVGRNLACCCELLSCNGWIAGREDWR